MDKRNKDEDRCRRSPSICEHDLNTPCLNQRRAPPTADALRLRSAQRSWRTIQTVGGKPGKALIGNRHQSARQHDGRIAGDRRRENTRHERMQRAALVGKATAFLAAIVMPGAFTMVLMGMMVMDLQRHALRSEMGMGGLGRHDSAELGDQKEADQPRHNPANRPKPSHSAYVVAALAPFPCNPVRCPPFRQVLDRTAGREGYAPARRRRAGWGFLLGICWNRPHPLPLPAIRCANGGRGFEMYTCAPWPAGLVEPASGSLGPRTCRVRAPAGRTREMDLRWATNGGTRGWRQAQGAANPLGAGRGT